MHTKIRAKIRNLGQSEDIVIEIPPESVDNRVGTGKTATGTETSLTSLILPVQAFYRHVLLIPSSPVFRFNPETKRYEHGPVKKSGMVSNLVHNYKQFLNAKFGHTIERLLHTKSNGDGVESICRSAELLSHSSPPCTTAS